MLKAPVRVQLVAAALMWLIGSTILLVRGAGYVHSGGHWIWWAITAGLIIGIVKAHLLLDRTARKAVERIYDRGRASIFGFFSVKSWLLIVVMMRGGITLRHIFTNPTGIGAGLMGTLYLAVGFALITADRVFWRSVFSAESADEVFAAAESAEQATVEG